MLPCAAATLSMHRQGKARRNCMAPSVQRNHSQRSSERASTSPLSFLPSSSRICHVSARHGACNSKWQITAAGMAKAQGLMVSPSSLRKESQSTVFSMIGIDLLSSFFFRHFRGKMLGGEGPAGLDIVTTESELENVLKPPPALCRWRQGLT